MNKWTYRFLELAKLVSGWSKDPSTKVGAVITKGNKVISVGFNGFASGIKDTDSRLNDRDTKIKLTLHGELNAILTAKQDLEGCTLICTHPPCSTCASVIIQSDISKVIFTKPSDDFLSRWGDDFELSKTIFREAEVDVIEVLHVDIT